MPDGETRTQMNYSVLVFTLGCKVNQYDSGAIYESFRIQGFKQYKEPPGADRGDNCGKSGGMEGGESDGPSVRIEGREPDGPSVVIINTCIVSAESERKSRQAIRRMRAKYPNALLAVAGCYPQRFPRQASEITGVDFISGISGREALVEWALMRLQDSLNNRAPQTGGTNSHPNSTASPPRNSTTPPRHMLESGERTRSYIKIQDGCNNFCSYCIVPYTRGRARSRELSKILKEVDFAVSGGAPEIIITGINISAYSGTKNGGVVNGGINYNSAINGGAVYGNTINNSATSNVASLGGLIDIISKRIKRPDRQVRLRLSSLEPTVVTPGFVRILSENRDVLCPHFHLSLQSGSETVLRRMNRAYTPAGYNEAVSMLRAEFPEAGLTTDIIAGFPGESADEFQETYDFCRQIGFSKIHVFPYSKRPGTRAADLPDQIGPQEKRNRVRRLIELSEELSLAFHRRCIGKDAGVLIENVTENYVEGITGNYIRVRASIANYRAQNAFRRGEYITVRVTGVAPSNVLGIVI